MNRRTKKKTQRLIESRVKMNRRIVLHPQLDFFLFLQDQISFFFDAFVGVVAVFFLDFVLNIARSVGYLNKFFFPEDFCLFCSHVWAFFSCCTSHIRVNYFARAYLIQGYNRAHIKFRWTQRTAAGLFCTNLTHTHHIHTICSSSQKFYSILI